MITSTTIKCKCYMPTKLYYLFWLWVCPKRFKSMTTSPNQRNFYPFFCTITICNFLITIYQCTYIIIYVRTINGYFLPFLLKTFCRVLNTYFFFFSSSIESTSCKSRFLSYGRIPDDRRRRKEKRVWI